MSKEVFVTNNLHRISDHIALPEVQAVRQTARKRARK